MAREGRKRPGVTIVVLAAVGLGCTGCELIPSLISGSPGEPAATSAMLGVTLESVEGTIDGVPIDATGALATGSRSGGFVQLDVMLASGSVHIGAEGVGSADQNPYLESRDDPFLPDAGRAIDGSGSTTVIACASEGCRSPDDFGLEIAETAEGRAVVLDGTWDGGDLVHIEMRYRELR